MVTNDNLCYTGPKLETIAHLQGGHDDVVWQARWSPNGEFLATCGTDRSVCIWRKPLTFTAKKWEIVQKLTGIHTRTVRCLAWSPSGEFLASAGFDATVCIWRRDDETCEFEQFALLEGHESEVKSLAWSANGELLASCSRDRSIWLWGREDDDEESSFECVEMLSSAHSQDVKSVAFHPTDSNLLASAGYDDLVCIHHGESDGQWTTDQQLSGHTSTAWAVAFAPNGKASRLASASADGSVRLWKQNPLQKLFGLEAVLRVQGEPVEAHMSDESIKYSPDPAPVSDVSWSPNSALLATISGGYDRRLRIYAVKPTSDSEAQLESIFSSAPLISQKMPADPNSVQFMPSENDDELILSVTTDNPEVIIFRLTGINWGELF